MSEQVQHSTQQEDSISLRDMILRVQDIWQYLLKKWLIILVCGLVGAGLGVTYSLLKKPRYVGEITFVLEDSKSSPLAAYAGLASQFGINLGAGSGGGVFEGENILEFLKSRLMIEKTLLSPVHGLSEKMSLADLYIKFNELDKAWMEKPTLKGLHFPLGLDRSKFTLQQDSILNTIQDAIAKQSLNVSKPDKKLSFISVRCTSKNEMFSKAFTERLVKEATDFYVNTRISRSKVNVDKLQVAADSLVLLLNRKTYSVAASQDLNQNPARQIATVGTEVQARDKLVLQTMYAEVIKNLELSKMTMAQETPVVQIVDTPILPLEKQRFGKLKGIILGGFLGGFFIIAILVMKKLYRELMSNEI